MIDCRRRKALVLRAFRGLLVCLSLFTCARSVRCHMGQYALLRQSGGGHQAAELGCGRLRRCPVTRPVADPRIYDTPYGRRRTLTAAYRTGACLSLDGCRAVPSQRLFSKLLFLICAKATSALFLFLRYRGDGKCRDKNGKQKRRKNLPAVSASYDPSCVCSIVQFWWSPIFREAHFDILRVLNQSEKLLAVAFHPCLLCSDLNA